MWHLVQMVFYLWEGTQINWDSTWEINLRIKAEVSSVEKTVLEPTARGCECKCASSSRFPEKPPFPLLETPSAAARFHIFKLSSIAGKIDCLGHPKKEILHHNKHLKKCRVNYFFLTKAYSWCIRMMNTQARPTTRYTTERWKWTSRHRESCEYI